MSVPVIGETRWLPVEVIDPDDHEGWESFWLTEGTGHMWLAGQADADHLPDSPALPAVARFLAEQYALGIDVALELDECRYSAAKDKRLPEGSLACIRSLITALSATAVADGGAG